MTGREAGEGICPPVVPSIQTWVIFCHDMEGVVTMRSLLFDLTLFFCYSFRACQIKAKRQGKFCWLRFFLHYPICAISIGRAWRHIGFSLGKALALYYYFLQTEKACVLLCTFFFSSSCCAKIFLWYRLCLKLTMGIGDGKARAGGGSGKFTLKAQRYQIQIFMFFISVPWSQPGLHSNTPFGCMFIFVNCVSSKRSQYFNPVFLLSVPSSGLWFFGSLIMKFWGSACSAIKRCCSYVAAM